MCDLAAYYAKSRTITDSTISQSVVISYYVSLLFMITEHYHSVRLSDKELPLQMCVAATLCAKCYRFFTFYGLLSPFYISDCVSIHGFHRVIE